MTVDFQTWRRAVVGSQHALDEEKAAFAEWDKVWVEKRLWTLTLDEQVAALARVNARIREIQSRIHSWSAYFEEKMS